MRPEEADIAKRLKKALPSAQQEKEAGRRVFSRLLQSQNESQSASVPDDEEDNLWWKTRPRLLTAVAFTAAVAFLVLIGVVTSGLWRRTGSVVRIESSADLVGDGESVWVSNPDGRILALPDGSWIEMSSQSELQIGPAADGLRVRLRAGSVIVTAAKQGGRHLYVETRDAMVSVVGSVFIVSNEQTGSRVGVIDGQVSVQHGAISQNLLPGEQVATDPAMAPVPLDIQVAWSRSASRYLALLQQSASPAQLAIAAAPAAAPQSRPGAASQNIQAADSLLVIGTANNAAASRTGQRAVFGNNLPGNAADDSRRETPDVERAIEEAMTRREPVTDLTVLAETNYFQLNRAEYFVPVTLKIAGPQLAGSESAKRIFLDIVGAVTDDYGTHVSNFRDGVDVRLTDETAKEVPMRQIAFETGFTLLPGRYSIKFLVRDRVAGRMGTFQTAVVIPNLNRAADGVPMSSVVLSSELISLDDALSNSQPRTFPLDSQLAVDPLFTEGKKLIPSVTRVFTNRRDLIVYFQAYEPNAAATEPLTASVALYSGQRKVFETPPFTVKDDLGRPPLRTLPVKSRVPLTTLPLGAYDCEVTILNPATQKSAVWRSPINVVN